MGRLRPAHFSEPNPPACDEWDAKWVAERAAEVSHPSGGALLREGGDGDALWTIEVSGQSIGAVARMTLDAPVWASPAYAIELNLRKGGTTHPYLTLQFLTDGVYDAQRALFLTPT